MCFMGDSRLFFRRVKTKIAPPRGEDSPLSAAFMHLNRAKVVNHKPQPAGTRLVPFQKQAGPKESK